MLYAYEKGGGCFSQFFEVTKYREVQTKTKQKGFKNTTKKIDE